MIFSYFYDSPLWFMKNSYDCDQFFSYSLIFFSYYLFYLMSNFIYLIIFFFLEEYFFFFHSMDILSLFLILIFHYNFLFNYFIDLTCVDFIENKFRFQLVYNIVSKVNNFRLICKTWINDKIRSVFSLCSLFSGIVWFEREIMDLFGIYFFFNPDSRRILLDYAFVGYALRKDFPLTGYFELRFNDNLKRILYDNIKMVQEFRSFDVLSPWFSLKEFKFVELFSLYHHTYHFPMHKDTVAYFS